MLGPFLGILVNIGADVGWVALRIKRAHSGNERGHHTHRVRVMPEGLNELHETVVIVAVDHDLLGEGLELLFCGQLAVDNKESCLQEGRFLCQLLNRIASVFQNTLLAINERYFGNTIHCVHVRRVE